MVDNNEYTVIASSDRKYGLPQNCEKISKILNITRPVLVTDVSLEQNVSAGINSIYNTLKASICIPIIMEDITEKSIMKNERRKIVQESKLVIGYVYIESQRVLNNLNNDSMKKRINSAK